jgi:hypothetical protein
MALWLSEDDGCLYPTQPVLFREPRHRVDGLVRKPWYEYCPFCSVEGNEWANQEMPATSVRSHTFLLTVML